MKTCKAESCSYPVFGKGYCKAHQRLRADRKVSEVKPRKQIRPMGKKLAKERVTYRQLREEFLSKPENMFCAVYPSIPAETIHHKKGRQGALLNDTRHWVALSLVGHQWVEEHPLEAKKLGLSINRLS